jgi:hypothetical protein
MEMSTQTNPNLYLLDESVKANFQGSPQRKQKMDRIHSRRSNVEGEELQQQAEQVEQNQPEQNVPINSNNTVKEKRYLGMKKKTAIWVGVTTVLIIGGFLFYKYVIKSKNNVVLES